jgi:ABC-2 type transport system permease protein
MLGRLHLRNEWRLLARHPLVWLALAGVTGFAGIIANGSPGPEGSNTVERLLRINLFVPSFILPFLAGAIGPIVFLREAEHEMREIVGSYPITVRDWLAMRLGSGLALLLGACLLAQMAFLIVLAPNHFAELPGLIGYSLVWLLVIHLPSCLIWICLLVRLSSASGNAGLIYLAAGFGWLVYLGLATLSGTSLISGSWVAWEPLRQTLLVLDPYAITAMINPMPEQGPLQWRAVNLAVGRLVWLLLCWWLVRGIIELPVRRGRAATTETGPEQMPLDKDSSRPPRLSPTLRHIALLLRHVVQDRTFPLIVGGWLLMIGPEVYAGLGNSEPLVRVVPDSRDALNRVWWDVVPIAATLLLAYSSDRVCRMYAAIRMHELVAATPFRSWAHVTLQMLVMTLVTLALLGLAVLAVLTAQFAAQSAIQPAEYLPHVALLAPQLVLLATLFVAVHALVRARYLANLTNFLLTMLCYTSAAYSFGLYHPLWRPAATPLVKADHYWGFEGSLGGHAPYLIFWAFTCFALLVLAMVTYHRNMGFAQIRWLSLLRRPASALVVLLLAGMAWQGQRINTALRTEGLLLAPEEHMAQRADYEKRYAHWNKVPQPDVAALRFRVAIAPGEQQAQLQAMVRLTNRTSQPIRQVLIGRNQISTNGSVHIAGAKVVARDLRLGQQVFQFAKAMQPGDTRELEFKAQLAQSGLEPAAMPLVLRPAFSTVPAHLILPVIGFKRQLTLREPTSRRQHGLPDLQLTPPSRLPVPPATRAAGLSEIDSVISVRIGHYAIAPGELVRTWQADGLQHFHYRSLGPIKSMATFFSLPRSPQKFSEGDYIIETHTLRQVTEQNINVLAARDTLVWLGREVAPYPTRTFRLIAVPEIGFSGYALPQTALLSHQLAFRTRPLPGAGFSQAYRRAVHETAHQWFGHMMGYGLIEERSFLVEPLAKYAELVMIEQRFGKPAMRALVEYEWDRYRQGRLDQDASIEPLIDAEEGEDLYSRATLVFACLRQEVGDKSILRALRLAHSQSSKGGRPMRSLDFVNALADTATVQSRKTIHTLLLGTEPLEATLKKSGCTVGAGSRDRS